MKGNQLPFNIFLHDEKKRLETLWPNALSFLRSQTALIFLSQKISQAVLLQSNQ